MPWSTPTLKEVRVMVRDDITAAFAGTVTIGNSVLRIMADAMSGLAHLTLRYLDWLSRQFLPDTAEKEWLDRHGDLWLINADGSTGRKSATLAAGSVTLTGTVNSIIASGTQMESATTTYETTEQITLGAVATEVAIRAIDAGINGNQEAGLALSLIDVISGVDGNATVVTLEGGTDEETDEDLRSRVLFRIQQPPMGGDANDYVAWALAVPGVTRAWCSPNEMGIATVTVRFMMDILRSANLGFPLAQDISSVLAYMSLKRPVAVKDFFVEAPIPYPISFSISNLADNTPSTQANIAIAVADMLHEKAAPAYAFNGVGQSAQTIYAAWVSEAISSAQGVSYFDLIMSDQVMPNNSSMAILGSITYV